jgi:ABC-type transport system substrate-binding protein
MQIGGSDLVPGLAQSWTISEDGLTYTFKLRHGVKFQSNADFKPTRDFNADDVVFSFRRMFDKSDPFYTPTLRKPGESACQAPLRRFCLIDDPSWLPGQRIAPRPD